MVQDFKERKKKQKRKKLCKSIKYIYFNTSIYIEYIYSITPMVIYES